MSNIPRRKLELFASRSERSLEEELTLFGEGRLQVHESPFFVVRDPYCFSTKQSQLQVLLRCKDLEPLRM